MILFKTKLYNWFFLFIFLENFLHFNYNNLKLNYYKINCLFILIIFFLNKLLFSNFCIVLSHFKKLINNVF